VHNSNLKCNLEAKHEALK